MSNRHLKVTWTSNAPFSGSGYGQQTYDVERQLIKSGWDKSNFALINMFGHGGQPFEDKLGIINYPSINHIFGSDALLHHSRHFKADVSFTLLDIWPQNPQDIQQVARFIPWVPVDYDPITPAITQNLRLAYRIISMSKFGKQKLQEKGFNSFYIPHHVDTDMFFPIDKKKRKIEAGLDPNTFIFGMVAANKDAMPRKSFQQVLDAFAKFNRIHPQSLLYIHSNPEQPGGFPIKQYAQFLGIDPLVIYPDQYTMQFDTPKERMNLIYNTFDCYLGPSSSEGFNIPVIEAQACGVPVIVNNWTSMPELIIDGKTGFITKLGCKHFFQIGSYMAWPDTEDLYQKMELMFKADREQMGKTAKLWIDENYSLKKVWNDRWMVFLDRLEKEIYSSPALPLTNMK